MEEGNLVKKTIFYCVLLLALVVGSASNVFARALQKDVDQATTIIDRFRDMPEQGIPDAVLRQAKGLAIITALKAGFIFSGEGGSGVVVARTAHGWSGPSALGTGGAGFGFQAGAEVNEIVLVLNTPEAVNAFAHKANVKLGADVSVAAGPVGRNLAADVMPVAAVYTYSRSQGLYGGVSLEGAVIVTRNDANADYYGRPVSAAQILSGKVRAPAGSQKLRVALGSFRRDHPRS